MDQGDADPNEDMIGEETAGTRSPDFIDEFNEERIIISGGCRSIDTWHARIA
jgi:hypothetical protein